MRLMSLVSVSVLLLPVVASAGTIVVQGNDSGYYQAGAASPPAGHNSLIKSFEVSGTPERRSYVTFSLAGNGILEDVTSVKLTLNSGTNSIGAGSTASLTINNVTTPIANLTSNHGINPLDPDFNSIFADLSNGTYASVAVNSATTSLTIDLTSSIALLTDVENARNSVFAIGLDLTSTNSADFLFNNSNGIGAGAFLTITSIPEPSSLGAGICVLVGSVVTAKRRRQGAAGQGMQ